MVSNGLSLLTDRERFRLAAEVGDDPMMLAEAADAWIEAEQSLSSSTGIYYAAGFSEVDASTFADWQAMTEGFGGRVVCAEGDLLGYDARVMNAADARPSHGDTVLINSFDRIDGFSANGRYFIATET